MSFIQSYLTYGLLLWGPMALSSEISKITKLQKKAVRLIENSPYNAPSLPLFKKHKIMKISDLIKLELGKFMFNYCVKSLPNPLVDLFQANLDYHSYNTRNRKHATVPRHKSDIFHNSFLTKAPSIMSTFTDRLKRAKTVKIFINIFKDECFQKY